MCTYNGALYLDEQLETIVNQDYPIYEIVVVDDLSTDETIAIIKKWQLKFPGRIRLFLNEENIGFDRNFEKAITLCSGDLVAVADQDDVWLKNKLSSLVPLFADEKVLLAHGASLTLKDGKLHHFSGQLKRYRLFEGTDSRRLFLLNQISGHNMIFRKSLADTAFPLPLHMPYDWWLALQATAIGKIKAVHKYLVYHRKHDQNAFFSKMQKKNPLTFLERMLLFRQLKNLNQTSTKFLDEFIRHLTYSKENPDKWNSSYYRFLYTNSALIFGHKKRIWPRLTYMLNALKFSKKW